MFEQEKDTLHQGGYRKDENPNEQNGALLSPDGATIRPRFNPHYSSREGGVKQRKRFSRPGMLRVEKVEPGTRNTDPNARLSDTERKTYNPERRQMFNAGERRHAFRANTENAPRYQNAEGGEMQYPYHPRPKRNQTVYSQRKRQEYIQSYEDPTKPIRLNKFLANAGICSRREADDFIQAGVITVNGQVVDNLGAKVLPTDKVMFHDQPVRRERKVYILLNKPKNTVTTTDDPEERHTVLDIVRNACAERIYPVGRLDRNTTGVLLLTNDGDLASKLTHPKYGKKKIYAVTLDRDLDEADEVVLRAGVEIDGEKVVPDALEFPKEDRKHIGIEIHSGQNRVVRRMFEKVGYKVTKLDRVSFAGITKKNVARGKYRFLTAKEVAMLQMGAFE